MSVELAQRVELAELVVRVRLDWSAPGHWEPGRALPCRVCGAATHMRDRTGAACDKGCAEDELARELVGMTRALVDERYAGGGRR